MAVKVEFKSRSKEFIRSEEELVKNALSLASQNILTKAQIYAPHLTGELKRSGKVLKGEGGEFGVSFGDFGVKYAKRRHYENHKHRETLRYLARAGDEAIKQKMVERLLKR